MIFKNNNKIANIYRGTLKISNVYRGGILVYTGEKSYDGLTFEALEPSTIKYTPSTVSTAQYSYDTVNWQSANNVTLNLNKGDRVFFKGNITGNQTDTNYSHFEMTGKISASGSIMSMQNGDPQDKTLKYTYEFYRLFQDCPSLVKAPELPATTLTERCYMNLFVACGLTEPTALPATTLAVRCYQNLFNGCSKLTSAPELPATKMVDNCYANLFLSCSSLTTAPELPATTLDVGCYQGMFYHSGLTKAPVLPATTLVTDCYKNMFNGCSKLNYIKAMFTNMPSSTYTANWVKEVASNGTFVKNKDANWIAAYFKGIDGIPEKWTIKTA